MALCNQDVYVLNFEMTGSGFPEGRIDFASVQFRSNVAQKMTVDYNDGTSPVVYPMSSNDFTRIMNWEYEGAFSDPTNPNLPSTGILQYKGNQFADGVSGKRIVKISFEDPAAIIGFFSTLVFSLDGLFPENILSYTNIETFTLNYARNLTGLPSDLVTLSKIRELGLASNFYSSGSGYMHDYLPRGFLNLALTNLSIPGVNLAEGIRNGRNTNMQDVDALRNTLIVLNISQTGFADDEMPSEIADAIVNLNNLHSLYANSNPVTKPMDFMSRLTQISTLSVGGGHSWNYTFADWGDLSTLVDLESFQCPVATHCPTFLPPYFKQMPKLNDVKFEGSYGTQDRWDAFIESAYTDITNNADIDNDDSTTDVILRNFTMNLSRSVSDTYTPEGTYQQPSGYVQGSNNGTPASQLEKIWVLVNQYNINVLYTT